MSTCACMGGPNCCRNRMADWGERRYERRLVGSLIEVKEYWPDGQLRSWTWRPAAPDAAAASIPSPSEVIRF